MKILTLPNFHPPGGWGAQGAKMRFGQSMGMLHIKMTVWTRGLSRYPFQVSKTKHEATRAKNVKKIGQTLYFLVLFGVIFTEYGHAVHQNNRLEEGSHMLPF